MAEHKVLKNICRETQIPIYGVAWKDDPTQLRAWLDKYGSPYIDVGLDPNGEALIAMGATGVPETFVIKDRRIIFHYAGALDETIVQQEIMPLLKPVENAR